MYRTVRHWCGNSSELNDCTNSSVRKVRRVSKFCEREKLFRNACLRTYYVVRSTYSVSERIMIVKLMPLFCCFSSFQVCVILIIVVCNNAILAVNVGKLRRKFYSRCGVSGTE